MTIDSTRSINKFLFFKLPAAFWCGIRATQFSAQQCTVNVKHRWINQNPFRSMYFAVQAMAAELTTGALVMFHIQQSNKNISLLVVKNEAVFCKKATGLITFICNEGDVVQTLVQKAIETKEEQTIWLTSIGTNEEGVVVSEMKFCWGIKLKS